MKFTPSQKKVLIDLDGKGLTIIRSISARTGLRAGTVGRALANLTRRKLAKRLSQHVWEVTEKGEDVIEAISNK